MQTVRGRFNGATVELLDDVRVSGEAYVLVTFLEGTLETAAARVDRRSVSVAMYALEQYTEPLRRRMGAQTEPTPARPYTVGEIMTRRVITVAVGTSVAEATQVMRQHGITSVLVEPGGSGEWGIMTMRDVLAKIVGADRNPEEVRVAELATSPVVSVAPEMSLRECSKLMIDSNIRRAAVREHGRVVGIISDTDIFQLVEERGWGP
ncbi:MAG: hypothetical protein RLZZ387_3586 [Chloroflexota bacterium]|jgi:isocitrate dehydrogenase